MELTIFAKQRTSKDGRPFTTYLTTLTKKDGSTQTVAVKFREECGAPKADHCPMNIVTDKGACNLAAKGYVNDQGDAGTSFTLWVSKGEEGEPYRDTSLDEYDV